MEFKVLGPVQVSIAGKALEIGGRKRRLVLAALLARADQPVPIDTLVEAVWGAHPPVSARRNLQLYVHQLRRVLGAELIPARSDGYAIDPGDGLDATRFRRLVAEGGQALDADDPATAETKLRTALDLWRGLAFADFLDCELVAEEAQRLEQLRLETYERWAEATLVTGATPSLAAELAELSRLHPYREALRAHLMRALYQTGRQAEALAVFREARALLVEELGIEPGLSLRRLHEAILRGEETLVLAPRAEPPMMAVPRELPPDPPFFIGRVEALQLLDESLVAPFRPVVVSGMGGVGKTTLAVYWSSRVADRFPDGQLYINLRGFAPGAPLRPVEALGLLLRSLGVRPAQVPVELDAAIAMYRTRLAGRRILLVLDNARDAEQVRPLLPATPDCLSLVTSRDRLTGLVARDGARRVILDVLTPSEAAILVTRLLGDADPHAVAVLAGACGQLPLAIRIAAAHLADRPGLTIAAYADAVRANLDRLEVEGDPEASVRATFAYSYHALDPAPQRLFRLLGVVSGPDVTAPAAAALADIDPAEAQRLLDALVRAHLVDPSRGGRYALHDLLRAYAVERARATDEAELKDASTRLHDFYLVAVDTAAEMLYPQAIRLPIEAPVDFPYRTAFLDPPAAAAWVDAELTNLVAMVEHAAAHGPHRMAWLLANSLGGYFRLRARYGPQWLATAGSGLAAAAAEGDRQALAATHHGLAVAHQVLGRPADAIRHATEALNLSRQLGWRSGEGAVLSNLGAAHAELGQNEAALAAFDEALAVHQEIAGAAGRAGPLSRRCGLRVRMGRLREALQDGLAALESYREVQDPSGEAQAWFNTGVCYLYLGEFERAERHLTRSIELYQSVGERYGQTLARSSLSKLHCDASRYQAALECGTSTLRDALQAEYRASAALSLVVVVDARRHLGDQRHAVRDCARAVQLARRANQRNVEVNALIGLAEAFRHAGWLDRAKASLALAHRITSRYGYRLLEGLERTVQAEIELAAGDPVAATETAETALAIHRETGYRLAEARCLGLLDQLQQGSTYRM